jgi:ABC-type protease/lipase transport system fused ATPase/permease subunit
LAADRTHLIIAHRLSTIVDADQILVLSQATGGGARRHADLLAAVSMPTCGGNRWNQTLPNLSPPLKPKFTLYARPKYPRLIN